ncbi:hypothetical protein BLOT_009183 [Blomia tropicalis]|nr:hypothetical protein BLOT_009183 [Blomia tropicalis]
MVIRCELQTRQIHVPQLYRQTFFRLNSAVKMHKNPIPNCKKDILKYLCKYLFKMAGQVIWFIKFLIIFEILSTVIAAFGNSNENINSTNHFLEFVNQCNDMANKVLYNKNGNSSVIQCCTAKLRTLCIKTNCSQPMYGSWCGPEQLSKFINKSLLVNCQNNSWTLEYCQDLPNHWKEPVEKDAPIPKIAKTEVKTKPIEPIPKITKVDKVKNYGKGSNPTLSTIRRANMKKIMKI